MIVSLEREKWSKYEVNPVSYRKELVWARAIVTTAVVSILLTAPLGLLIVSKLGPRMLERGSSASGTSGSSSASASAPALGASVVGRARVEGGDHDSEDRDRDDRNGGRRSQSPTVIPAYDDQNDPRTPDLRELSKTSGISQGSGFRRDDEEVDDRRFDFG